MKTMWIAVLVAGLVAVSGSAFAGAKCCASKGKDKAAVSACSKATAGLDLTAEQKAKIAEIEATCKASECSKESSSKAMSEIRDVLTAEQQVKFDAACEDLSSKKGGGCG